MRVVAGELGGRRLVAPAGARTRPTAERVRAALFDRLSSTVTAATVLDLYAGSGALGIEALSRGAKAATFVERAPAALAALRANLAGLGLEAQSRVLAAPVERVLARLERSGERFSVVLVDAPYAAPTDAWQGAMRLVEATGGVLVAERDARQPSTLLGGGRLERRATYGATALEFWRVDGARASGEED